jgi:hypothetical protein
MCPSHDVAVVGFGAQRQCRLAGGFCGLTVACVVLHAADQQSYPSSLDQDLPVLFKGHALALQLGHPAQPGAAFGQELIGGHERVLRAQPVCHDAQSVECGRVKVGPLQPAHQLQRVHACHGQDIAVGVPPRCDREHRVGNCAERLGNDRLVELLGLYLPRFPAFPLPQQALIAG